MTCPYSDRELEMWDSVCNPMGSACYECEEYDCEHNENEKDWDLDPEDCYDEE